MAVYVVVNVDIRDLGAYGPYRDGSPAIVAKHGGEYLARGGTTEVLEGDFQPARMAILKFPDLDHVKAMLSDPEYAPLKSLRHSIATTQMIAVQGV